MLVRLLQIFDTFELDTDAQPPDSRPPPEWKALGGRQAVEKFFPKTHLTMYSYVSYFASCACFVLMTTIACLRFRRACGYAHMRLRVMLCNKCLIMPHIPTFRLFLTSFCLPVLSNMPYSRQQLYSERTLYCHADMKNINLSLDNEDFVPIDLYTRAQGHPERHCRSETRSEGVTDAHNRLWMKKHFKRERKTVESNELARPLL